MNYHFERIAIFLKGVNGTAVTTFEYPHSAYCSDKNQENYTKA